MSGDNLDIDFNWAKKEKKKVTHVDAYRHKRREARFLEVHDVAFVSRFHALSGCSGLLERIVTQFFCAWVTQETGPGGCYCVLALDSL